MHLIKIYNGQIIWAKRLRPGVNPLVVEIVGRYLHQVGSIQGYLLFGLEQRNHKIHQNYSQVFGGSEFAGNIVSPFPLKSKSDC